MKKIEVSTDKKYQLVNITKEVDSCVKDLESGIVNIFTTHTTAGILITEDEKNLKKDWLNILSSKLKDERFLHDKIDDNARSHILAGLISPGETLPVERGAILGRWQNIFLVELDGPRNRKVIIKSIKND